MLDKCPLVPSCLHVVLQLTFLLLLVPLSPHHALELSMDDSLLLVCLLIHLQQRAGYAASLTWWKRRFESAQHPSRR